MQYYSVRPRKGNTIFVDNSGVSVDRAYVAKAIKQLVSKAGEDPVGYNTHSLRVGRASDLAVAGESSETIQRTGRWKSEAYLDYVRFNVFHLPATT